MIAPAPPGADVAAPQDNGAAVVGDGAQTPDEPVAGG